MLHLALNQNHQSRCREEVDQLINPKIMDNSSNTQNNLNNLNFTITDLGSLKYLERCVLESFRITPTVPIYMRKLDAPLNLSDGFELGAGTSVVVPLWMIHRDPDNFPNSHIFDPDRFLPENMKKRHPYSFIPFSSGPRNCIGYKVALMDIKVIMAWILRTFEIYSNDSLEDVKLMFELTLRPERNYKIVLKRRQL